MTKIQQDILIAVDQGALVLTVNRRLSRYLRDCFDLYMLGQGKSVWTTPEILSVEGWLNRSLSDLGEGWRLLSPLQQQCLWEQQIEDSSRGTALELLQLSKTAEKALQAHKLLNEYGLSLDDQYLTEDQRVFRGWQSHYIEKCQNKEWLGGDDLPQRICSSLTSGEIEVPDHILLVGFDQLSPSIYLIMETVRSMGGRCDAVMVPDETTADIVTFAAHDSSHEIVSAACWARHLLDQGKEGIGIVVPDLQVRRNQIERIFRQQIDPAATVALHEDEAAFSLSLGGPLASQGVIYAALECLGTGMQMSLEQISFLLRTPYLAGSLKEVDSRALFDQKIRSFQQSRFKLSRLIALLDEKPELVTFLNILRTIEGHLKERDKVTAGEWAKRFADELNTLGWPGDRGLVSREYQAIKVWQDKALASLLALDSLLPPISRARALNLLRRIGQEIEFQIEGPTGPVQVVGLLESSGLHFNYLWVMGLGETVLPARAQPNPFIPIALQRLHDMSHSSSDRELQFAEHVMTRLQSSSEHVVFSYPRRQGDCELRPSPLIPEADSKFIPIVDPLHDFLSLQQDNQPLLDCVVDHLGPGLSSVEVEGGTGVLKDQAHCPFRAFFHHRLYARAFSDAAPGITPMVRGELLHLVLENVWNQIHDHRQLLSLNDDQLKHIIDSQVGFSLTRFFECRSSPSEQLLKLEGERLFTLAYEWLENIEKKRDYFKVVETEQQLLEQIGDLKIRLKVDRIDQLENGNRIIIDYKTGTNVRAEDFFSRPLVEPQLPIYAVADTSEKVTGLVFAQVRRGECRLSGVVAEKGLLGRVRDLSAYLQTVDLEVETWDDLLIYWGEQLTQLSNDFVAGKAAVDPYDLMHSCQYCDLTGICRIHEDHDKSGVQHDS